MRRRTVAYVAWRGMLCGAIGWGLSLASPMHLAYAAHGTGSCEFYTGTAPSLVLDHAHGGQTETECYDHWQADHAGTPSSNVVYVPTGTAPTTTTTTSTTTTVAPTTTTTSSGPTELSVALETRDTVELAGGLVVFVAFAYLGLNAGRS